MKLRFEQAQPVPISGSYFTLTTLRLMTPSCDSQALTTDQWSTSEAVSTEEEN
ncbi:hypothetical protein J6590_085687 [Homalodisca vitripennis]|nr:hypothetical protein J6590_085687 [Homalodisca vitripennis]